MCKLRDNNNNGFTLLEILVAIVLLSIGLLAMASLTVGIMGGNLFSNQLTTATTLAQDKMEDVRRRGYSGLPASDTTTTEDYGQITGYPLHRRVTFTDFDYSVAGAGLKKITVTVFWDLNQHSVALNTIVAE